MSNFRDSSILIIEIGRTAVRAGLGIQELLKTPTVVRCTWLVVDPIGTNKANASRKYLHASV
jgi:hypothetical protein